MPGSYKLPTLLVSALDEASCETVIKDILSRSSQSQIKDTKIWSIDNKYYNSDVYLEAVVDSQSPSPSWNSAEGIIIYIQNSKGENLTLAETRKELLSSACCDVNILLCDKCDSSFPKEKAMAWALQNDFELIELLEQEDGSQNDSPIKEYYGIERAIQTLHTHSWSNMKLKDKAPLVFQPSFVSEGSDAEEVDSDDMMESIEHMDKFCELFSQLPSNAQTAAGLPTEERKAYAEKMVKAFWKAIGGDEDELDDGI